MEVKDSKRINREIAYIESEKHTEKFRELCERHINHADLIHETDGYLSRRCSTLRIKEASASRSNSSSDEL